MTQTAALLSLVRKAGAGSGPGGAVSSVFGRSGAVTAQAGDYAAHYRSLSTPLLSSVSVPFTNGDTVQRVTVTDAAVSPASKVHVSVTRTQANVSEERGYVFIPAVVRRGDGEFDVQVVCLDFSGMDPTLTPPNETLTLTYMVN